MRKRQFERLPRIIDNLEKKLAQEKRKIPVWASLVNVGEAFGQLLAEERFLERVKVAGAGEIKFMCEY